MSSSFAFELSTEQLLQAVVVGSVLTLLYVCRNGAVGSGKVALDKNGRPLPGPTAFPIIGSLHTLLTRFGETLDFMYAQQQKHNRTFTFTVPFTPRFVVSCDPASVEHVLKNNFEGYVKGSEMHDIMHELLGNGIFNSDGETWRVQRKTAANIFNVKNFRDFFFNVFTSETADMLSVLDETAASGIPIDLSNLFFRFTLDSFMRIGFGKELGCLRAKDDHPFAVAFDRAQLRVNYRFFSPFWRLEEIFGPSGRIFRNDCKLIHEFAAVIIKERRQDPDIAKKDDLLSLFMNLRGDNGEAIPDSDLSFIILNFIIAGRDTTAQALSWCFYLLSKNPEVEQKLYEEAIEHLGTPDKNRQRASKDAPTYEQIKNLKYANAVFSETLRLYPSVPKNVKRAVRDDVLPDGTQIREGNWFSWSPYVMGRMKSIWGPDAEEFKPERWINTETPSTFKYPAFHAGPRTCLGMNMAYLEGVYALTSIVRSFRFKVLPGQVIVPNESLTLPMKNGLMVTMEPRL